MTHPGSLGREYRDGEIVFRQGDVGESMYVVMDGEVEIVVDQGSEEVVLAVRGKGDIFGEMAIFEREARMATVRARGTARILTVDKRSFLRRVHEDPSLAFRVGEILSHRIRELSNEVARLKGDRPE